MDPSLVGSQMSSDASSEQSSTSEGTGYDEAFGSSDESEGFSHSSERETSAYSLDSDVESYAEESKEVVDEREDEVEEGERESGSDGEGDNGDEESCEGTSGGPRDNHPFILLEDWAFNKFLPTMSDKIFKELRSRYQIPDHIPIRLPREDKRCYSGRIANIGMYDAMFATGLRLPLTALHRQLADFLGLSVSQIAPNACRIFISAEIPWGRLSGGNH